MKQFKDKKVIICLVIIIMLQTVISVYAGFKRENYHIDEYYSHGLIQYKNTFIMSNEDFYDKWHDAQYFKDYVEVKSEEKWDFSPVYKNQVKDVHPPMYYLLLRIVCSFNLNNFSKWPGIILNIVISVACTIILFLIGEKLFKSKYMALLVCLVNAMCIATIQTITFIRMYELFTLNSLLIIYWHIISKDKNLKIRDLLILGVLIITGFLTHYYYAIIVGSLYFIYLVKFIKEKRKKDIVKYTLAMGIAVILAICIFPYCIYHIFFGYRGQEVIGNMGNIGIYLAGIYGYIEILQEHILNGNGITILLIIFTLGIIAIVEKFINKKQATKIDKNILYILIPQVLYFGAVAIGCRFWDFRYIMPITPLVLLSIVYIIKKLIETWGKEKISLIITTVLCIIFCLSNIPKYANNLYTGKGTTREVENVLNIIANRPFIAVTNGYDANKSKFMETYQLVSKVNETYVINADNINIQELEKALKEKNTENGIVMLVRWQQEKNVVHEILNSGLFNECIRKARGILLYYNVLEFK